MIRRFARPYARAIVDVAQSPEKAMDLRTELSRFEEIRAANHSLQELYANPGIDHETKLKVSRAIFDRLKLSEMSRKILEVLISNRRINDLGAITEAVATLVNRRLGIEVADVTTAHELSGSERKSLSQALEKRTGKKIELRVSTDPSLIAGLVARVGDEIIDVSVAGRIRNFQQTLTTQNRR